MECGCRFTAAEGGARLVSASRARNTLAAPPPDHAAFIATRLLHESAHTIRGSLCEGQKRSVYVTRTSRVPCVAYDLAILTDLTVSSAKVYEDVSDWCDEVDKKQVLVTTTHVFRRVLEEKVFTMANLNVVIIESCHLVCEDDHLQYIMRLYKESHENDRPRILALTYPLFAQDKKSAESDNETNIHNTIDNLDLDNDAIKDNNIDCTSNEMKDSEMDHTECQVDNLANSELDKHKHKSVTTRNVNDIGAYRNLDDFEMYEKLEWKLDVLEQELCCEADLAEDIDGVKRLSASLGKPREQIIEFDEEIDLSKLPQTYIQLDVYMRQTVRDVLDFLCEHRFDPTEIYGEDLYEEIKNIPDPTLEPKYIFHQFLYVLDQLGPYGADKAAFSLLTKLEKLKIKVPYERHFLLLCMCTSVFVKIRCAADLVFQKYEHEWDRIKYFSTPKVLRFVEILEKFKPSIEQNDTKNPEKNANVQDAKNEDEKGTKKLDRIVMLKEIDECDFTTLGNKIEDRVHIIEGDLKEIVDLPEVDLKSSSTEMKNINDRFLEIIGKDDKLRNGLKETKIDMNEAVDVVEKVERKEEEDSTKVLGFQKRPHRVRGRGRVPRTNQSRLQSQLNPDALCSIVFIQEPLMTKILFMIVVELSRNHPDLRYLCGQYCAIENPADPVREPREFDNQRRRQEEVLKKFRMHECNLLLATSALEEGIDLPRCNLVLRWDLPPSYRSYGLCRGRARAPRSACVVLARGDRSATGRLLHHIATYKELDQIVSRKCGCGLQDEPPQAEESHADTFNSLVKPYTPHNNIGEQKNISSGVCKDGATDLNEKSLVNDCGEVGNIKNRDAIKTLNDEKQTDVGEDKIVIQNFHGPDPKQNVGDKENDSIASVDLNSAIALINRYCGKLPSDTFTRLAPQCWMEQLQLPLRSDPTRMCSAYVCTLRLPLNCPVKYNIVGHPMPSRVLARRAVALQACRVLHRSGELDNNLMPIGKENFRAPDLECASGESAADANDPARPGTTKRRQYYYKRTASAFTNCQPIIDTSDSKIDKESETTDNHMKSEDSKNDEGNDVKNEGQKNASKRNVLYAISCRLWCALPERYNTRGRRLHAPQTARQALAILMARPDDLDLQIPAFPVYTRSGEVRVSVERVRGADVRLSPRRGRLIRSHQSPMCELLIRDEAARRRRRRIGGGGGGCWFKGGRAGGPGFDQLTQSMFASNVIRRFMRFVFAEVLRVRRRGMRLQSDGSTHNNYYIVPTVKTTREDGSAKIDIDWPFLELIYQYTEGKKNSEIDKSLFWHPEDDEDEEVHDKRHFEKDKSNRNVDDVREKTTSNEVGSVNATDGTTDVDIDNKGIAEQNGNDKENTQECKTSVEPDKSAEVDSENREDNKKETDSKSTCQNNKSEKDSKNIQDGEHKKGKNERVVKKMDNPLLGPGDTFVFDADKYREAVVTPWYRNQDQPQFFLVAEICWGLSPASAFPSATHTTFRSYYSDKYGVTLTQPDQPLLDVDHTSARLNLLTPRYVNRKGVALPVSSERTRRAKRDRLDQKQILVPELCRVHPFAAPLWFSTVALPCVLYRINALLIADEIRRAVAIDVGLGIPKIDEKTCPRFEWPPLDFGWSLAEVLNVHDDRPEKKKETEDAGKEQEKDNMADVETDEKIVETPPPESTEVNANKTLNDILQEKENAEGGFEIGTWSNEMASSIPTPMEYDEYSEPLPPNLTFCTSASGGTNWCDPVQRPVNNFIPTRTYSVVDSDCSYMSSDFDTDDSDMNSEESDDDIDTDGLSTSKNRNAAMGIRIEYKTAHEAEAVDVTREKRLTLAPQPDEADDANDRGAQDAYLRRGEAPAEYIEKFQQAVEEHKSNIVNNGLLVGKSVAIMEILPEIDKGAQYEVANVKNKMENNTDNSNDLVQTMYEEMFPYATGNSPDIVLKDGHITLEDMEKSKRALLSDLKKELPEEEIKKMNLYSMVDVDIDSPNYVDEKVANVGFDEKESYVEKLNRFEDSKIGHEPCINRGKIENGKTKKDFDFDFQPKLEGHPGPSPSVILQALTMSNANDGINLERLETIGDSFLKFAITAYLYCAHPTVHEGKLSHMRSKQVSNLNLYRLGRSKRLGARMIASKFEPHDNWLPPCHRPPPTLAKPAFDPAEMGRARCVAHGVGGGAGASACRCHNAADCYIPYNLITQHSIPDKSIADCVEALIGAYLIECGPRGALLFMSWLGIKVLPRHEVELSPDHPYVKEFELAESAGDQHKIEVKSQERPKSEEISYVDSDCSISDDECYDLNGAELEEHQEMEDWSWPGRVVGSLRPYKNEKGQWVQAVFGELKAPPSPLLRYIADPEGELEQMLSGYDALERTLEYRFRDRSLLLQALTHASHSHNRLTDCYQRLEFLGDAILDYLITRYLYEDERRHSPGALTDLRSALVNNTIFATLAVRHGFHKYFRHMSPGLNEVLTRYVKIQEENGHSISEEHYLIQEDEMEQAEDVEVPKALGDLFESVAGAIFLDSGMSLGAVWGSYVRLMGAELEAFSAAAPKSPVRELLEAEPDTAKFGKPERLADGRRVRVCVEVFGRGTFKGVGRNYRIAKGTAARCALRHLRGLHRH